VLLRDGQGEEPSLIDFRTNIVGVTRQAGSLLPEEQFAIKDGAFRIPQKGWGSQATEGSGVQSRRVRNVSNQTIQQHRLSSE